MVFVASAKLRRRDYLGLIKDFQMTRTKTIFLTRSCSGNVDDRREVDFVWQRFQGRRIDLTKEAGLGRGHVDRGVGGEGVDVAGPVVGHFSGHN
jgi:hypothetical protein